MTLLPFKNLTIHSSLSLEEVRQQLQTAVAPRRSRRQWQERRVEPFEGTVTADGFRIRRIIGYRNSFLPILEGHFHPQPQGIMIVVTMKLHPAVMIFSIVWLGMVGMFALLALFNLLTTGLFDFTLLWPVAMVIFFCIMVVIGFGTEAEKASDLLGQLLKSGAKV